MTVTAEILGSYRHPARAFTRLLAGPRREDRALVMIMAAAGLIFVSRWPEAVRAAHFDTELPLEARLAGALFATVFVMPLCAYLVAALSHLLARAFGGRGSHYGARIALFWSLLSVAPLMLVQGLAAGLLGPGAGGTLLGLAIFAVFLWLWASGLRVAEFGGGA
ncbi:MAG: YIP1 family protein [Rhodobacteraceae bacterium]|nr:YIP1 family protein [Paracoccaceae bacterium]